MSTLFQQVESDSKLRNEEMAQGSSNMEGSKDAHSATEEDRYGDKGSGIGNTNSSQYLQGRAVNKKRDSFSYFFEALS